MPPKKILKKDIRLSNGSLAAARECLQASYIVRSGVEASLALCTGIRYACGLDQIDESLFEEDATRIMYCALPLATSMVGVNALIADKLIDELERISITPNGPDRIWNSLAAAVGDAEPSDADLRVISIFKALKGGHAIANIEPQKSPRPSENKRREAIAVEREKAANRGRSPWPTFIRQERSLDETKAPKVSYCEAKSAEPGKIACRLMAYLHQGYVLVDREGLPESGASYSRLLPAKPRFDRSEKPRYVLEYTEDFKQKHYDCDYGSELVSAGWIREIRGVGDNVFALTPKGAENALRLFGSPELPIPFVDDTERQALDALAAELVSGEIDLDDFIARSEIAPDDLNGLFDEISWYGDDEDIGPKLEEWREANLPSRWAIDA